MTMWSISARVNKLNNHHDAMLEPATLNEPTFSEARAPNAWRELTWRRATHPTVGGACRNLRVSRQGPRRTAAHNEQKQ
jgi:hypothetical protein